MGIYRDTQEKINTLYKEGRILHIYCKQSIYLYKLTTISHYYQQTKQDTVTLLCSVGVYTTAVSYLSE